MSGRKAGENIMIKSYKIRLLPTTEQEQMMWDSVNASRFVWNWGLAYQMERFNCGKKNLSAYDLRSELKNLKDLTEFNWLSSISNKTTSEVIFDLDKAYKRFFTIQRAGKKFSDATVRRAKQKGVKLRNYDMLGYPKFKKKDRAKKSFIVRSNLYFFNEFAVLERIGRVKYQTNYNLPIVTKRGQEKPKISNSRICYENGKWILSFGMECENQAQRLDDFTVGIDLGVKNLAVLSNGKVFKNVNKSKRVLKLKKRLKQKQKAISRKYRTNGSYRKTENILKSEKQVEDLHRKLRNIRKDYTHKTTTEIIRLLPKAIVLENLNVSGMMKNRYLSRAIQEQNFCEFARQIKYKSEWNGIQVVLADRFYPSSKKCSSCGLIKQDLKLSDRVYRCECCGLVIDRDLNAALNLESLAY